MVIANVPSGPVDVPAAVARLAGSDPVVPVWRNTLGGLTFRLGSDEDVRFAKWMPPGTSTVDAEVSRLAWASRFVTVPTVLEWATDDAGSWMLTVSLPGDSAVDSRFRADAAASRVAARAVGRGLRRLHDELPVDECPYTWSVPHRIERARSDGRHPVTVFLSASDD